MASKLILSRPGGLTKRSEEIAARQRQAVMELAPEAVAALHKALESADAKERMSAWKFVLERVYPLPRDASPSNLAAAAAAGGAAGAHMAALAQRAADRAKAIDATSEAVPALPKGRNS